MADSQAGQRGQGQAGRRPVVILDDEVIQTQGRDAQSMIIAAGVAVAEAVRTTLGPRGMDKMMVNDIGDAMITNDGVTILDEMDVDHPAAKLVIEVAESQEHEIGDGTTTAVVLAGALLLEADELIEMGLHPGTIVSGYEKAAVHATDHLESIATTIDPDDTEALTRVARTALTGKNLGGALDHLAELAVKTVQAIAQDGTVDKLDFEIMDVAGAPMDESFLVEGVIIDKDRLHVSMPKRVEDAEIALIEPALKPDLDSDATNYNAHAQFDSAEEAHDVTQQERDQLREMVETVAGTGANVVFTGSAIDNYAQHVLVQEGIFAHRELKKRYMRRLVKAVDGEVASNINDLAPTKLGRAGLVEERRVGDKKWIFVEDTAKGGTAYPVVRGSTDLVAKDAARALDDAIDVVAEAVEDGTMLAGGGAPETDAAHALRDFANTVDSREQLAVEAFADALETIPRTLANNAGLDPIDALVELRRRHANGETTAGLDVESGDVLDGLDHGVVEPLQVKRSAISSAQEAATMLLRIDDVVSPPRDAIQKGDPIPPPPGGSYGPNLMP